MKIGNESALQRVNERTAAKGTSTIEAQIDGLRQAKTLVEIGGLLSGIARSLPSDPETDALSPAFSAAMQGRPGGVRSVVTQSDPDKVRLFCGAATPQSARQLARDHGIEPAKSDFSIFSTGDPFVFLGTPPNDKAGIQAQPENVDRKTVYVLQGDQSYAPPDGEPAYDQPTLVAEALQIAFAAKANGARKAVVIFPESLDPRTHPQDRFAQLVSTLARASGVDEVQYRRDLASSADESTRRALRSGLEVLGPKTSEVDKCLTTLEAADSLDAVARALTQLDIALTGLSGKYDTQARALGAQVAKVLTEKVTSLVAGLPSGVACATDDRTVVLAGHSNPELSADVAFEMGARLGRTAVEFNGNSPYALIADDVAGKPVVVVQTTRMDPYTAESDRQSAMALLTEALMLCDEANKAQASDTTLVLPYMPNARSDKQDQKGVGAYAALVARWVDALDLAQVILVEPHDIHVPAFFRTPTRVISGAEVLVRQVLEDIGRDDVVLVRPDEGATKRTKALGKDLNLPVVNGEKSRADNLENAQLEGLGDKSDVAGKIALVTDDEIATGGTMRQTVSTLKDNGAKEVHVAISHANMPTEPERRHASIRKLKEDGADSLYLLDTQPLGKLPADLQSFVKVVSIASAIASEAR